jgi:hypothetical protein
MTEEKELDKVLKPELKEMIYVIREMPEEYLFNLPYRGVEG